MAVEVHPGLTSQVGIEHWLGKVHQGDCIELMNQMPAASVDLFVTSPPYNIKNSTGKWSKEWQWG